MNTEATQQEKRLVQTKQQLTEMLQQMHSSNTVSGINTGNIERIRGNVQLATWVEQQWTEEMINNHFKEINVWCLNNLPLTMPKDEIQQFVRNNGATSVDDQQMEG